MIKTAIVALTVVGCDCDAKLCEYISETPAQWATLEDCEAAMTAQIVKQGAYDYPLISGVCRTVPEQSQQMVSATGDGRNMTAAPVSISAAAPTHGTVAERPTLYDGMVEGSRIVFRRTGDGYQLIRSGIDRAAGTTMDLLRRSASLMVPNG